MNIKEIRILKCILKKSIKENIKTLSSRDYKDNCTGSSFISPVIMVKGHFYLAFGVLCRQGFSFLIMIA
jgi:hypothetical protein